MSKKNLKKQNILTDASINVFTLLLLLHQGDSGELGLPGAVGEKVRIYGFRFSYYNFSLKQLQL